MANPPPWIPPDQIPAYTPNLPYVYRGRIDLVTARVQDLHTGAVYTWAAWRAYRRQLMAARVTQLRALRDESSDLQNLWGTKADRFKDNWFDGYVRPQIPPNPRADFPDDGDEPPTTPTYPPREGGPVWDLPGIL